MSQAVTRVFEDKVATREPTPLFVGVVGPSSSGKTYSALRLATGIQRVVGGDIHFIDTERNRALHYAEDFKFRHVPFGAPFGPLDYLTAIEHCVKRGAKTLVVDSMSHEHEGPGGVLEQHAAETERLVKAWKNVSRDQVQLSAWAEPKKQRRQLINAILQLPINVVFCFRAKEKLKIVKGQKPEQRGWMPIAGEEFIYEMVLKCLLLPGANGTPTWTSKRDAEAAMIKLPGQFRELFSLKAQLSEDIGEELARWAAGAGAKNPTKAAPQTDIEALVAAFAECRDRDALAALEEERKAIWRTATGKGQRTALKNASDEAVARLTKHAADDDQDDDGDEPPEPGSDG